MRWPPDRRRLEGSIVRLEPIDAEHRGELRAASREAETWTWLGRDVPDSDEAFSRWFDARLDASQAGEEWCFVTRSLETARVIGSSSYLHIRIEHDGIEIGWTWLHPAAWRTGANVEAKLLMLTEAFDGLGCMRVEFKTDARNERSRAALEALPAVYEGIFRQHMLIPGVGKRDSAYYSILDSEWPTVRANLARRLTREPTHA